MNQRPLLRDEAVLREGVRGILPAVISWLGNEYQAGADDELLDDLYKAYNKCLNWDGYELAKALDSWMPDSELVEILENGISMIHAARSKAIKAWVEKEDLKPKLAVGATVEVWDWKNNVRSQGTITGINLAQGVYVVNVPSLGHVLSGKGTHGQMYAWDQIERWNTP